MQFDFWRSEMNNSNKLYREYIYKLIFFFSVMIFTLVGFVHGYSYKVAAADFQCQRIDVNEITIELTMDASEYKYTGKQIKPHVLVTYKEALVMLENGGLHISYGTNIEPGKGTVTITGTGASRDWPEIEWYGTKTIEFEILKADNPLVNTGFNDGTNSTSSNYYDGYVIEKNVKKSICDMCSTDEHGPYDKAAYNEIVATIKKKNLNIKSSDKNIFKVNKDKNSITLTGVGIAYIKFTIPETKHYKAFKGKMKIISLPPEGFGYKYAFKPYNKKTKKENTFTYGVSCFKGSGKSKTNFKCKIILATNKKFTKSSIIKSYQLSKNEYNSNKVKRIKSNKIKKGKTFYLKQYTYIKLSSGETLYGYMDTFKYKINKKGKITNKLISSKY